MDRLFGYFQDPAKRDACAIGIDKRLAAGIANSFAPRAIAQFVCVADQKPDSIDPVSAGAGQ